RAAPISHDDSMGLSPSDVGCVDHAEYPSLGTLAPTSIQFKYDWRLFSDAMQRALLKYAKIEEQNPMEELIYEMRLDLENYWNNEWTTIRKRMLTHTSPNRAMMLRSLWVIEQSKYHPKRFLDKIAPEARKRWKSFLAHRIPPSSASLSKSLKDKFIQHMNNEYEKIWDVFCAKCIQEVAELALPIRAQSFKQSMTIRVSRKELKRAYQRAEVPDHALANIPRSTRPPRSKFFWRRKKINLEQESNSMAESTIVEMQSYLIRLVQAHSIRVEDFRWLTKANADDVARDIIRAMGEVWTKLVK
ncbi:hypothetical protein FRC11_011333, partial [Ceratobasidium sp. 423]